MDGTNAIHRFGAVVQGAWILSLATILATATAAEQTAPPAAARPSPTVRTAKGDPSTFTRNMPFGQAIDILRRSTDKPLNIVVYWKEIGDNAGVYRDTPIGFDGVKGLSLGQHLKVLLGSISATSPVRLGYVVHGGVIIIATTDRLPKPSRVTRVYDVSDLVAPPSQAFGPGMMGGFGGGFGPGAGLGGPMDMGHFGQYGASRGLSGAARSSQGRSGRR